MGACRILTALAASLVLAAGGVVLPAAPAVSSYGASTEPVPSARAACSGDSGVSVIVDFNEVGGGVTAACDPDGAGKVASQVFPDAGYPLTYTQEDPGFACRVSGKPADAPCVRTPPATAYWSLWWSDGESGQWVYSSSGVSSLDVPDGGYLAFAWHQGSGNAAAPDVAPTAHTPEPSGDDDGGGDTGGTGGDGPGGDQGDGDDAAATTADPSTASTDPSASESASDKRKRDRDRDPTGRGMSDDPSDGATSDRPAAADITAGPPADASADTADRGEGQTFPTWIALVLAALVLGAAAMVPLLRRRSG